MSPWLFACILLPHFLLEGFVGPVPFSTNCFTKQSLLLLLHSTKDVIGFQVGISLDLLVDYDINTLISFCIIYCDVRYFDMYSIKLDDCLLSSEVL